MAGFTTAFATVAVAGIGDKSFLTALVLAARHKARWVFTGSFLALTTGAALWIGLGAWMQTHISMEIIKLVSGVTFLGFGIKAYVDAYISHSDQPGEIAHSPIPEEGITLSANAVIRGSFTTTFLAEFGDRTQLALLGLAAGPDISAESIFTGAVAANILLAIGAVTSGKCLSRRICQKRIALVSGTLFIALGVKILMQTI